MSQDPPDATWRDGHRRWPTILAAEAVVQPTMQLVAGLKVVGQEHVPPSGPLLVVANHVHNADPVLLWLAMPRALHFMGKKELFEVPPLAWLLNALGGFPVDRGAGDRAAIRTAVERLATGYAVAMFPEGTRSPTGRLQPGHPGAGLIAVRSGAPILPVGISGTRAFPTSRTGENDAPARVGRGRVLVNVGRPFTPPPEVLAQRGSSAAVTSLMMAEIGKLLPPDQRAEQLANAREPRIAAG